ncbi:hypothetical protein OIDMADRAFT_62344 [Oidiodendron maius Zn]|uniref:Condensation domain-containing protein n=1 Tax=Oidiodendron maius (strain Zn) TaxID=913774 RepID=A0A0C3CSN9_OIDMZ|nr:hypothetical protein OIDMADRAFT_62344 [Oidiodendron maius Zn]
MAAIFNAAFSYTLFRKTARTDIRFGQMVHGRISSFAQINEVVGPLCSIKLVRIQIQPSWTILDFIRHIEGQHRKMMHHEQVDVRNVTAATPWPIGTQLGSIVNQETMSSPRVPLYGIESSLHQETPPFLPRGLWIQDDGGWSAATFHEQVSEYLELFLPDLEKPPLI